jgi:hypothetical protein
MKASEKTAPPDPSHTRSKPFNLNFRLSECQGQTAPASFALDFLFLFYQEKRKIKRYEIKNAPRQFPHHGKIEVVWTYGVAQGFNHCLTGIIRTSPVLV